MTIKFFYAVSILSGTIIGAGLFALPYITTEVGFTVILFYLLFLGFIAICIHCFFSELALKTEDNIRLPGFANIHLGPWAKKLTIFSGICGLLGAILAYIILGGQFLSGILEPVLGGNDQIYTLIYLAAGSILIFLGIKAIEKMELLGVLGFIMILALILFRGWSEIDFLKFLEVGVDHKDFFLPYGAVLFSLWGAALIPEIEETLGDERHKIKWVVFTGVLLPIVIYLFFIIIVVGITGAQTSEEAILGLLNHLDNRVIGLTLLFGILATFTSFVALGLTLKKILWYDMNVSKNVSWAVITFLPLSFFLFGVDNYIQVISVIGAFFLAIDAVLVTIMYQKYKPDKYKFLTYPIIIFFILGIVYNIIYNKEVILNFF